MRRGADDAIARHPLAKAHDRAERRMDYREANPVVVGTDFGCDVLYRPLLAEEQNEFE